MAKASRVLAALKRDGWVEIRRTGSHRTMERGGRKLPFTQHEGEDLGGPMMAKIAKDFGYTLEQLRRMA